MAKKYSNLSNVLKKLLFNRGMKPIDLARAVNMHLPTIHRLVTGKSTRPYKSSLIPIAKYFSISVDELIGEAFSENQNNIQNLNSYPENLRSIPIITWKAAHDITTIKESDKNKYIMVSDVSENSFALVMHDKTMEPLFNRGTILIFDPKIIARDHSYVLVKLHESKLPIFRQLLIDANEKFIKSLSPELTNSSIRLLGKDDEITSCLVEARLNVRPDEIENLIGEH